MSVSARKVTIEIDVGEPIRGRLLDGTGASRPFRGWLELSAMLEGVRRGDGDSVQRDSQMMRTEDV
jgi:hypothetical protein